MQSDEELDAEDAADLEAEKRDLKKIRAMYLKIAATTEAVAKDGGRYREVLMGFARDFRARAADTESDIEQAKKDLRKIKRRIRDMRKPD
ncbi:MAG: hypothetical protein U1E32_02675 [Rhodoglobus sp.]|nr:hypothetical protein [Rhodoglobus sp.]